MSAQTKQITDAENHLHPTEARWFAVYTRFKSEKVVKRLLDMKNIENYLPIQSVTRRYTRKIKTHDIPLISCYIFVRITRSEYVPVMETENVVRFIRFARNLLSIPESEINILRRVVGENLEVEAEAGILRQGDLVEVIGGKLTGLQGRLVDQQGKKQMVVELENVGYSLKISVDTNLLRRI